MSKVYLGYNGRSGYKGSDQSQRAFNRASKRIDNELFYIDVQRDIDTPAQSLKKLAAVSVRVATSQHPLNEKQKEKSLKLAQDILDRSTTIDAHDYIGLCKGFPEFATEWRKNPAKILRKDGSFPYEFLKNILSVTPNEQKHQTIVSNDEKLVTGPTVEIIPPGLYQPNKEGLLMAQATPQGVKIYVSCEQGIPFTPKTEKQRTRSEPFYETVEATFPSASPHEAFTAARKQKDQPKPE